MTEMHYSEFVEVYEELGATTKMLEKTAILAKFLEKLKEKGKSEWIYLLRGRVVPEYDPAEFGISEKLIAKAIAKASGVSDEEIMKQFRKVGDFGEIAVSLIGKKKQSTLFLRKLTVEKVFENLKKVMSIFGSGAVDKKLSFVVELLTAASGKEAQYIVRTVLGQLRIGMADGILRDAIALAFFDGEAKEMAVKLDYVYGLSNDFAIVFEAAMKGKKALDKVDIALGKPINVMLPVKVTEIAEAFRIVGKPASLEHKYDGFRMIISKKGNEVKLFTRKLEEVTKQFPDVVNVIKKNVKGDNFMLDSEVVGYEPKTHRYKPFESISQRIKRKYDIDRLEKELPVEINVFDVIFYGGNSEMDKPFTERRKLVEKIIKTEKWKIRPSHQIVTGDEKEAEKFYKEALKIGEEGIMFKKLDAPYHAGRRVGYIVKLKPSANDFDLVIVGAEYGRGKRAGWLTSFIVACREGHKFVDVGMVSSGLKEKEGSEDEGAITYNEMTKLLKPLITKTEGHIAHVQPKVVVSVTYQNIQKSPSYSSGYAMRFPRITAYRPDRGTSDIATLEDVKRESKKGERK